MKWLLDPGGTRLKWARISDPKTLEFAAADWADAQSVVAREIAIQQKVSPCDVPFIHILKRSPPPAAERHGFFTWTASLGHDAVQDFDPLPCVPFSVAYASGAPGSDRLAAASACHHKDPGGSFIIIDAGTCITVDLLSPGHWRGGAILPGLNLQAQSMAKAGLPVLAPDSQGNWPHIKGPLGALGTSTQGALQAGISRATLTSVEATAKALLELDPCAQIMLTGGDAAHFDGLGGMRTFADPNLVLSGGTALLNSSLT